MKRIAIALTDIADLNNLALAAHKAARAKRNRAEIQRYFASFTQNLNQLSADILAERVPYGGFRGFAIFDPKPRTIHAAQFEDRVLHHALMNFVGPVLDKAMTPQTFACREGYGVHKAASYALTQLRRYPYFLKLDIKAYFASISHQRLLKILEHKLKGQALLSLIARIIYGFEASPGRGLPIGSLCSQHFANYYLNALDRAVLQIPECKAYLRYMDDMLMFCNSKGDAQNLKTFVTEFLQANRDLNLKENGQLNKTSYGVSFCGYRIMPAGLRLSARRRKRYQDRRLYWEDEFVTGKINALALQQRGAAVQSILQGVKTRWQHRNLILHPAPEV